MIIEINIDEEVEERFYIVMKIMNKEYEKFPFTLNEVAHTALTFGIKILEEIYLNKE